jgi:hypothetical protein
MEYTKHEIIACERCREKIECKANNYTQCQCNQVQLSLNELQYISENYEDCLCANCLMLIKEEYLANLKLT